MPAELVHPEDWDRLLRLAAFVPRASHSIGFECRLMPGKHPVDLGAALTQSASALLASALSEASPELSRTLAVDSSWRAIARFGRRWAEPGSASRKWIPFIFLEYDSDASDLAVAVPSVFAGLDSPIEAAPRECPELAAALEFAEALLGEAFDVDQAKRLELCFRALKAQSRVLHVAVMLGRIPQSIRLSTWIEVSQASTYLASIGICESGHALERLVALLPGRPAYCQLDFEVAPPVGRIGLGYRPDHQEGWHELLDRLVEAGCDPAKAAALLRWPGSGARDGITLRRELSHVKLGWDSSAGLVAKGYFGATQLGATAAAWAQQTPMGKDSRAPCMH